MDDAGQGLRRQPLQHARRHHGGQRRPPDCRVDVFHGRAQGARGCAAGDRTDDVHRDSISQRRVRARPLASRGPAALEVPARERPGGEGRGVLRCRESRSGVRGQHGVLQSARWSHGGRRRAHGGGAVAGPGRGPEPRRDDDDGPAGGARQSARGAQRRRDGRARMDCGARCAHRQGDVARLQPGPGRRRQDRAALRAVLCERARHRSRGNELAERDLAARRCGHVGMAHLRSGSQSRVLRHEQSRTVGRRASARRQQVLELHPGARPGHRGAALGAAGHAARRLGLRRGQ